MNKPILAIIGLVSILSPPLLSGPVAATLFITVFKSEKRWRLLLFWSLLFVVDFAALVLMACTLGHHFPGAGFFAYLLMPFSAVISLAILLIQGWKLWRMPERTKWQRLVYVVGGVMIPFLQLLMVEALPFVRESACCVPAWLIPYCY
jgi:hypothetical protein